MQLVGIARLASISPTLEAKRAVSYQHLPTRKWINRCSNQSMPFDFTINPYRGCEFGCKYCYARYTHEFMELRQPEDFERKIFAKHFHAPWFRTELSTVSHSAHIAIGTATDPYQPAERRYRITRQILQILAEEQGRRISLTTKSDLVARDAGILARLGKRNVLSVNVTVTTVDAALARQLEPRAPRPDLRLGAVRELTSRGVAVGVFMSPVLPGITDNLAAIRALGRQAAAAGASYLQGGVLFLKPCARAVFFPFLKDSYPQLSSRYAQLYARGAYLRGDYPDHVARMMDSVRREFRLDRKPAEYTVEPPESGEQLALFDQRLAGLRAAAGVR
ncbi:MAG: radical SAM protein [Bryobacterales bacterium]|nr:radical SAM protein [Bryobacterales bacterium]